ncbi:hypothetical protein ON010_g10946 [Phytophthora cinnamomi]|nr:hypothetical protein ON010_g10946 [Phytophthora cinnamomi]
MASRSLSSSSASTIPSVLENSNYDDRPSTSGGDASANYADEQFDLESDHVHESADPATLNSSSEKYASDEFEDDNEINDAIVPVKTPEAGDREDSEDDYDAESFEQEEKPGGVHEEPSIPEENNNEEVNPQDTAEEKAYGGIEVEVQAAEDAALSPVREQIVHPHVGSWCSKMLLELRDRSKLEKMQHQGSKAKNEPIADTIPATAVNTLIQQAKKANHRRRAPQRSNLWQPSCGKMKLPASFMHRAQTQSWLAKSARDSVTDTSTCLQTTPEKSASLNPARFCSVKQDKLLGQLATMRLSEMTKRWTAPESGGFCLETLEFVQDMAARQREIYSASSNEPGGRMLHRVMVEARMQLEESIALRHQADIVLEKYA